MNLGKELVSVHQDAEEVIPWVIDAFTKVGFRVMRSFDLQSACAPHHSPCPHHGKVPCSCQLIILIVYDWYSKPHAVTIHGHDGHSQIGLAEASGYPASKPFEETLNFALKIEMPVKAG